MSDLDFVDFLEKSLKNHSRRAVDQKAWKDLIPNISFLAGGYGELESFNKLSQKISNIEEEIGEPVQCLFYISTPPEVFKPILENLGTSGLAKRSKQQFASKVIIEKPFGRDLESAQELNLVINRRFDESQVFRIDHYLGKEQCKAFWCKDLRIQSLNLFGTEIMFPVCKLLFPRNLELVLEAVIMIRAEHYET